MKTRQILIGLAAGAAVALAAAPALAEKPEWAGQGKGHGKGKKKQFDNDRRLEVRNYYEAEYRSGHCPPGLAKKHNGCLPPGQAKKLWRIGQPLPASVVIYDLPPALVLKMGTPPAGYKYVRVASDILMIAVGTSIVAEAIRDLGRI
jgi:Ni/Co efflux regulator RcnB